MEHYHLQYPEYGFDGHKGYGTGRHMEALLRHGPCPLHRKTFRGVMSLTLPF
jgi:ribonuclease HII